MARSQQLSDPRVSPSDLRRKLKKWRQEASAGLKAVHTDAHIVGSPPGWISISPNDQKQNLFRPYPREIVLKDFDKVVRLINSSGLEIRLVPRKEGLEVSWWYHLPRLSQSRCAIAVPLGQYVSEGSGDPDKLEAKTSIHSWDDLSMRPDETAHQKIARLSRTINIPDLACDLETCVAPFAFHEDLVIRLQGCDITLFKANDLEMFVLASCPSLTRRTDRILDAQTKTLSNVPHGVLKRATDLLQDDITRAPLQNWVALRISNIHALLLELRYHILSFFRNKTAISRKKRT